MLKKKHNNVWYVFFSEHQHLCDLANYFFDFEKVTKHTKNIKTYFENILFFTYIDNTSMLNKAFHNLKM